MPSITVSTNYATTSANIMCKFNTTSLNKTISEKTTKRFLKSLGPELKKIVNENESLLYKTRVYLNGVLIKLAGDDICNYNSNHYIDQLLFSIIALAGDADKPAIFHISQ